jgi:hypothetical protein
MQGGSTNVKKIETWALICQFLLNYAAVPTNVMPKTFAEFTAILPEPLRSWCVIRRQALHGSRELKINLSRRVMEALAEMEGEANV